LTEVAVTGSEQTLYKCIIGIFAAISLGSVCLVVILVRSRHAFSVRPFHSGICIYIASFAPYALLKALAVGKLLEADTQGGQLTAGLMLNGTFMVFFWLGFGGKVALIQLWMHLISRHTSGESEHLLMKNARRTWSFMRLTVLIVCVLYGAGFLSLVGVYAQASSGCAAAADANDCIPSTSSATPPACQEVVSLARGIVYYEGLFAAVVVVVFTFYALVFNGLVYAMLTSDATFSNLSKLQVHPQPLTFKPKPLTYLLQSHQAAAPADFQHVSALDAAPVRARCRCADARLKYCSHARHQVHSAIMAAVPVQDVGRRGAVAHVTARARHQARRRQRVQLRVQGRAGGAGLLWCCAGRKQPVPHHVDAACGGAALAAHHRFTHSISQRQYRSCTRHCAGRYWHVADNTTRKRSRPHAN
jgi:hypothetical protein